MECHCNTTFSPAALTLVTNADGTQTVETLAQAGKGMLETMP